jgi:hypothetical protein
LKAPVWRRLRWSGALGFFCSLGLPPAAYAQDMQHPASGYLEVALKIGVDVAHTKVGQEFQAEALETWIINDCTLPQGAGVYGKVVSATRHTQSSPDSTLGLQIESIDCQGHPRTPFSLHVLEVIIPDSRNPLLSALPLHGNSAETGQAASIMGHGARTDSESRVGQVVGEGGMRLEIAEGPNFADVVHSDKRNVSLLSGTRLLLGTKDMIPPDQLLHLNAVGQP